MTLSPAENRVVRKKLSGHTEKEIADLLFVSPHTIHKHLHNIYEKTGVRNERELANWYLETILQIGIKKLLEDDTDNLRPTH